MKKMKVTVFVAIASVICLFAMSSCATKSITSSDLAGVWELKTINGVDTKTEFEGPVPTIEFNFTDGQVSGSGGCNRYFGAFTLNEKNEFSAPQLASTMMACMHKNAEDKFLENLAHTGLVLSFNKEILTFKKDNSIVLEFVKGTTLAQGQNVGVQPVKNETLKGTWTLTQNATNDVSVLYTEKVPTITFEDGKVNGFAGCNTYRGTYQLEDNTITFSPLMTTRMACPNMDGETKFTTALTSPLQATINGNTLSLLQKGDLIFEFTKEVE